MGGALVAGFGVLRVLGLASALLCLRRDYPAVAGTDDPTGYGSSAVAAADQAVVARQVQVGAAAIGALWVMSAYWFVLLVRGLAAVVLVRARKQVTADNARRRVQSSGQVENSTD